MDYISYARRQTYSNHDWQQTTLSDLVKSLRRRSRPVDDPFDIGRQFAAVRRQALATFCRVYTAFFRVFVAVRHQWLS
jgi:hypothetical protein